MNFDVIVIGGGTGGICTAARLKKLVPQLSIGIVEPSGTHHYQPLFTLFATGHVNDKQIHRPTSDIIPAGCHWIRDSVASISPETNQIHLSGGQRANYRLLVVAPGLVTNFDSITGLSLALNDRSNPTCSVYDFSNLNKCASLIQGFMGGTMIFSMPSTPIKCPSAPLKMLFLIENALRSSGARSVSRLIFITPYSTVFGVDGYQQAIETHFRKRGIEVLFEHEVSAIDSRNREVQLKPTTASAAERNIKIIRYDFAHITPASLPPPFIAESGLHHADGFFKGWLEVNPLTLQHMRHPNIFGLGDVAGLPTIKSATAARAQSVVVADNIQSLVKSRGSGPLPKQYNGYSSCPIFTASGEAMQTEIGYDGRHLPTFPGNPFRPSKALWWYNKLVLPMLYWNFLIRGKF
ncbi:MAG: NAD(P)/FAD-dependent oxidoreductase [Silvanigrellaceae bacterium]